MSKIIFEYTTSTDTQLPCVNVIYFAEDEQTGALHVADLLQLDVATLNPSREVLHTIDWASHYHEFEFWAAGIGKFAKVTRDDVPTESTLMRVASYYLHMMKADYLGYKDDEGSIRKGIGGNIFEAYMKQPADCYSAYMLDS